MFYRLPARDRAGEVGRGRHARAIISTKRLLGLAIATGCFAMGARFAERQPLMYPAFEP